jgi:hypothetical protein
VSGMHGPLICKSNSSKYRPKTILWWMRTRVRRRRSNSWRGRWLSVSRLLTSFVIRHWWPRTSSFTKPVSYRSSVDTVRGVMLSLTTVLPTCPSSFKTERISCWMWVQPNTTRTSLTW